MKKFINSRKLTDSDSAALASHAPFYAGHVRLLSGGGTLRRRGMASSPGCLLRRPGVTSGRGFTVCAVVAGTSGSPWMVTCTWPTPPEGRCGPWGRRWSGSGRGRGARAAEGKGREGRMISFSYIKTVH